MPTFLQKITNNQIVIIAGVANPDLTVPGNKYSAIVDTGAQTTMVSSKVIADTALPQAGHTPIRGVTGVEEHVAKYKARVDIPINMGGQIAMESGKEMEVVVMPQDLGECDVLLGMDFLSAFHITMNGGVFILSI